MDLLLITYTILICAYTSDSARILGIFHTPTYSHYALGSKLLKELAAKGHEVTAINPFPQKTPLKNFRDIELTGFAAAFEEEVKNLFEENELNIISAEVYLNVWILGLTEKVLMNDNVQQLLKSKEKFDVVIVEEFVSHALKGFCYHFNAPCVMFSSVGLSRMISSQVGNPLAISHIPDYFLNYGNNMNFYERLHNTFAYTFSELYKHLHAFPEHNRLVQKYFPGAPHMSELYYNVSLAFVNSHVSIQQPVAHVPNLIDIGGFHVEAPKKLSKDLQKYLDDAKEGVVFFSMGSCLKSALLPMEKRTAILSALTKLKLKVLWKWEDEDLPGKPANVKIGKWLPQSDILAHPNVKLFVTHGGLLSTIEAVYHGVPIVGIPVYADQKMNVVNSAKNGVGLAVPYEDLTEETFFSAMHEVLTNPKFKENAKTRSEIMHDQPIKPLDKAIFWVEYVIRHRGAPHLRSVALNLSWYQYLLLDIAFFIFESLLIGIVILYFVCRKIIFRKKNNQNLLAKKRKQN